MGRQTQRWSDFEFEGPARDNFVVDWPIRYKDVAPWYSYVEKFVGISGNKDGLPGLPDGEFLPPFQLSCVEKHFKEQLTKQYKDRHLIAGRCANITEPQPIHLEQGRGNAKTELYAVVAVLLEDISAVILLPYLGLKEQATLPLGRFLL